MTPHQAVAALSAAFPKDAVTKEMVSTYAAGLADLTPQALAQAVERLILTQTDPWLPTIGMIRQAAAEITLDLPDEYDAAAQVDARITAFRDGQPGDTIYAPMLHPLVDQALRAVGGSFAWRDSERTRAAFLFTYRDLRARAIRSEQQRPTLPPGDDPPNQLS